MARFVGSLTSSPARITVLWYASVAIVGTVLLFQPFSRAPEAEPVAVVDAAFTAVSALCVTGLTVRSTGNDFSLTGQVIILVLIQIGGIGIITVTTFFTLRWAGRQSLHDRTLLAQTLGAGSEPNLRWVIGRVVRFTLLFELGGVVLLTIGFMFYDHSLPTALWHALFHTVSAFCNAGFSLRDDSIMLYQTDWLINVTMMVLIMCGGIGYPVMIDLSRNWYGPWRDRWARLLMHTKLMLIGTVALILIGAAATLVIEWDNTLRELTIPQRVLASFFQSISCRTAGFNSLDTVKLTNATLFIIILLMMIGGGPCSTAGGFKVSTLLVLLLRGWTTIRGMTRINIARRTLPEEVVHRAITTAMMFALVSVVALTALLLVEQSTMPHDESPAVFFDTLFDTVSALATTGLSTGITPHLTAAGKSIIIALMFIGRLGPITVVTAVSFAQRKQPISYASEEPLIG